MKTYIKIIILLISTISYSQKGLIKYGYVEAFGIGNAKGPDYNAYLVFDKAKSYYVTAKDSLEEASKKDEQKTFYNDDGSGGTIHNGLKSSPDGDQVVYDIKKNTIWSSFLYRKQIYVKEITPKINWKIEKDTKKIGNFVCKKAIANFRGRDYIAWFAIEISVPYGPWKLNGLPGLILEAYDKNKNVYWYFKSVEYPSNTKEKIKYMTIPLKEKFKTYDELKKFQVEQQKKSEENSILLKKQYPQISVAIPKLDEMFIEFE